MTFQKLLTHISAFSLFVSLFLAVLMPSSVMAQSPIQVPSLTNNTGGLTATNNTSGKFINPLGSSNTSLSSFLNSILGVVIQVGAVVVVFFYIYAGFKFVVARGDSAEISTAVKTLTWTTVGAMVLLGAQVISTAIQGTVQQLNIGK